MADQGHSLGDELLNTSITKKVKTMKVVDENTTSTYRLMQNDWVERNSSCQEAKKAPIYCEFGNPLLDVFILVLFSGEFVIHIFCICWL